MIDRPGDPATSADDADRLEEESYRILRSRIDLSRLPRFSRDVTERVIHASADFDYATDLVCDEQALESAVAALAAGAPVIVDATMVAAGISGCPVICKIDEPLTQRLSRTAGSALARATSARSELITSHVMALRSYTPSVAVADAWFWDPSLSLYAASTSAVTFVGSVTSSIALLKSA